MFEILGNFLRYALVIMLLGVSLVVVGLAIAEYVRSRNVAKAVGMLAGAVLLIVAGWGIFWVVGSFSDDLSPNMDQTVDPEELVTNYQWGQQN